MTAFDLLAERKIAEAIARGELEGLPGEGRPLDLGDDALVAEDLRLAWRILKNAGLVPPEVEALKEISDLERCLDGLVEGEVRTAALRKLDLLRLRLAHSRQVHSHGGAFSDRYVPQVLDRLARPRR
jgi:hypothetical protein